MATNVLQHANLDPEFSLAYSLNTHDPGWQEPVATGVGDLQTAPWPGRLRLDAHHYYGLYGDRRFGCAEKVRFLGRKL